MATARSLSGLAQSLASGLMVIVRKITSPRAIVLLACVSSIGLGAALVPHNQGMAADRLVAEIAAEEGKDLQ